MYTILLVTGSRLWKSKASIKAAIEKLGPDLVIQGGCDGADLLAFESCLDLQIPCLTIPAKWKQQGKPAGVIRNSTMLTWMSAGMVALKREGGKVRLLCYAFHKDLTKSRGTADMVKKAGKAGIRVKKFKD